ncbi:hypothetical protein JOD01_003879 [Brevibacillus fulvus]|uniref:Uncharacterized protein n=1 Tax=Brevibacillus fulvus TaxID=1125967 RepID=A0A939BTV4_9BACL|nr:hypothetical protein [Brevibacillus fulvus]
MKFGATWGRENRARRKSEPSPACESPCITRPMTPEEWEWIKSLPLPKEELILTNKGERKRQRMASTLRGEDRHESKQR